MYCRVIRTKLDRNRFDDTLKGLKDTLVPTIKKQPGFAGFTATANRQTGDGVTVTYWETEKSEAAIASLRQETIRKIGASNPKIESFEIVATEILSAAPASR